MEKPSERTPDSPVHRTVTRRTLLAISVATLAGIIPAIGTCTRLSKQQPILNPSTSDEGPPTFGNIPHGTDLLNQPVELDNGLIVYVEAAEFDENTLVIHIGNRTFECTQSIPMLGRTDRYVTQIARLNEEGCNGVRITATHPRLGLHLMDIDVPQEELLRIAEELRANQNPTCIASQVRYTVTPNPNIPESLRSAISGSIGTCRSDIPFSSISGPSHTQIAKADRE